MGQVGPVRIDPGQPDLGGDAGQGGGVDRHPADIFPTDPIGQGDRQERRAAAHLVQRPVQLVRIQIDQLGQVGDRGVDIAGILAHHHQPIAGHVARQRDAVAVEQLAARGRDQADIDAVFLGQQSEFIGLVHLHIAHAHAQRPDKAQLQAANHQCPAAELAVGLFDLARVAFHAGRSPLSPGVGLRTPKVSCVTSTTSG